MQWSSRCAQLNQTPASRLDEVSCLPMMKAAPLGEPLKGRHRTWMTEPSWGPPDPRVDGLTAGGIQWRSAATHDVFPIGLSIGDDYRRVSSILVKLTLRRTAPSCADQGLREPSQNARAPAEVSLPASEALAYRAWI